MGVLIVQDSDRSLASAYAAAREMCRRRARGFLFACSFLPPRKRDAAAALCAFRMMLDDVLSAPSDAANGCCGGDSSQSIFPLLRTRMNEIYSAALELPEVELQTSEQRVLNAFGHAVRAFEVPSSCFLDFIEGREADQSVARYPTWGRLQKHCHAIEGSFAQAISCVMGLTHSDAKRHAAMLGSAIRMTQILRNIKDDWKRGRIYLPLEDMARFRYSERDLAAGTANENFRQLMAFQVARVRQLYREAAAGVCWLAGDGSRLAASLMLTSAESELDAIERAGFNVLDDHVSASGFRTMLTLPRAWKLARRLPPDGSE